MSFTWRYVVRPDGSFCRVSTIDGSLDNVSDEELARLHPADPDEDKRQDRPLLPLWRRPPAALARPADDRRVDGTLPGL
ncbi:hypothetical protein [Streptomyces albicerus]|uniref:hypothetical protein n=1 Tax=Streptomyces albicerus TaxID=2569859 RepID=UPI00124B5099|nr:hypothetical protein [Streptomyces albicerus]